jgi:hypothetical protein
MKNRKIIYLWIFVAALALFGFSETAQGCDCVGPRGKAALSPAAAAFSGKTIKIQYLDAPQSKFEPRIVVTFKVYRVWKGDLKRKMVLHTILNRYSCAGYSFIEDKEYLVFAAVNDAKTAKRYPKSKQSLGVSTCNGTMPLEGAGKDVSELGAGKPPK